MPNTPIRRLENCCVPPKKSAWRFDSTEQLHFVEPQKNNTHNMGFMTDDSEMKPGAEIKVHRLMETFSHIRHEQEDGPLDFSFKTGSNSRTKTASANRSIEPLVKCELKEGSGGANIINHPPTQTFYPSRMLNGNNSPPSTPNRSPTLLNTSHATSKDSDSLDMDYSRESDRSPSHSVANCASRVNETYQNNSPEHTDLSRENSPASQTSILEGMLRGQQQSNIGIPGRPQAFGPGYGPGFGIYENQIIGSPSPPMTINAPVMHPSMLPLSMAPYFGYGYVEHHNSFVPGYMYKPPESTMDDASITRKHKKKSDPLLDSLKACSVDELRKKLDILSSGNSLAINPDYAVSLKPSYTPQADNVTHFSNNDSPESVKNETNNVVNNSSAISKRENSEKDNAIVNHTQVNDKNNAVINHNKENSTTVTDIIPHGNSQNAMNRNETNNVANVSCTEDTNDSIHSAISGSPDGQKRKSIPDYKNDPLYKLKRAKNNLAARRSRESRRIKEELIRKTANILEQQNKVILRDFTALKFNFDESQVKYYTLLKEYENMKIQNSVLVERLNQKRCGQCGSALPSVN